MALRTWRARSTPARRITRCRAMSMPADTPAEVTTSPSSTNRSSPRTSMVGSSSARCSSEPQCVVAGRFAEGRRRRRRATRADTGHQRHVLALAAHPVQLCLVAQLGSGALATGVHQHLKCGASAYEWWAWSTRPLAHRTRPPGLGDARDGKAVIGEVPRPGGEHLPGSDGVSSSASSNSSIRCAWSRSSSPDQSTTGGSGMHRSAGRRPPVLFARPTMSSMIWPISKSLGV